MNTNLAAYVANSRKAIINVLTVVLSLGTYILTTNTLPDKYAGFITSAVGLIGFILHYVTSNAPAPGTVVASEAPDIDEPEDEDLPTFTEDQLVTTEHDEGDKATLSVAQALSEPEPDAPNLGKHEA